MAIKKRVVRKKKKNEASEALAKISGSEELEMAATILKELAESCLLYTSPSPRDATLSRMPSSA